jgi:hypothetical protein
MKRYALNRGTFACQGHANSNHQLACHFACSLQNPQTMAAPAHVILFDALQYDATFPV